MFSLEYWAHTLSNAGSHDHLSSFWCKMVILTTHRANDRNLDQYFRIWFQCMFLSSTDHVLSFDISKAIWRFKIQNQNFKVYRKIFPDSISWSCDSKTRKRKNNGICYFISNIKCEKTKIFHVRVLRFPSVAYLILWTISWPPDRILVKMKK